MLVLRRHLPWYKKGNRLGKATVPQETVRS